jgi:hypothetical protein
MPELPSYFEYKLANPIKDEDSGLYGFIYNEAELTFTIGRTTIPAKDFDPYRFSSLDLDDADDEAIELSGLTEQHAVLPDFSGVIGCPKLHDWVWENPEALHAARKVMHAAFSAVIDKPEDFPFEDDEHGFMGFAAKLRQGNGERGGLHLQVFGNCACMGPHFDGLFIQGMEHGFAQYDLHNADLPAQRLGLYAGFGYLARLASESRS